MGQSLTTPLTYRTVLTSKMDLSFTVRIPKMRISKLRMWKKSRNIESLNGLEIPSDWQNTLTKKYPSLKRSSSSVSSFTSSTSSSYSVSDFLHEARQQQANPNDD